VLYGTKTVLKRKSRQCDYEKTKSQYLCKKLRKFAFEHGGMVVLLCKNRQERNTEAHCFRGQVADRYAINGISGIFSAFTHPDFRLC